ncbi:hypothetical protein SAICODRAFT_7445 [Saitoella complicata NRRL Y-17804]|nr:uncharacterized protein SAICODRAFT_7445 [Saitoella complicata NRRL Y-17804]ODQ53299.1 hypothetical protein SAICODRAFT_7445 [Saitoella complicata NRRL Y-17804]
MSATTTPQVSHDAKNQRFTIQPAGSTDVAYLTYEPLSPPSPTPLYTFSHTYTPPSLRGRGLASILTKAAMEYAASAGWRVRPDCEYVREWAGKRRGRDELVGRVVVWDEGAKL